MDCPEIENTISTGYSHGKPKYPHCPVCDSETDIFYKDSMGDVIGCENCISQVDAWEQMENEHDF